MMFRLRALKNGRYQIHQRNGIAYEGLPHLIFGATAKLGIREEELVKGLDHLEALNHDYADFNERGWFIYTAKDKNKTSVE